MEIHQLRYFVAVAEMGSFTQAAERCHVTQPSLSQQIKKLETELGQPVFHRGKQVCLTDSGRMLFDRAVEILAAIDDAKRQVKDAVDVGQGRVAVGAIPTVAPYLLPGMIGGFLARHPQADVMVYENFTENTIQGCVDGELDLGVVALPVESEHLVVERLFDEELLLATAADHPLAKKRTVTLECLDSEPFILLDEAHCLGEQIVAFCTGGACRPLVTCRTAQLLTVQKLVALGRGVSLIPNMAAQTDQSGTIKYRSLTRTKPTRSLALVWRKHRYQSRLVKEFADSLRSTTAKKS